MNNSRRRGDDGKRGSRRPAKDPALRKARGLLHIGTALPDVTGGALRGRGFVQARLVTEWRDIVGESISSETLPERVTFPRGRRRDGTLLVRVASGAVAIELQHLAPQLLERINVHLGGDVVARLRFLQGRVRPRPKPFVAPRPRLSPGQENVLEAGLGGIESEGLRRALRRLGRSVAARGNRSATAAPAGESATGVAERHKIW